MPDDDHLDNATGKVRRWGVLSGRKTRLGQARFSIVRITPESTSSFLAMKRASGRRNQTPSLPMRRRCAPASGC